MSKYRIAFRPSRLATQARMGGLLLCVISIISWPQFFTMQWLLQGALCLAAVVIVWHRRPRNLNAHNFVIVDDSGRWLQTDTHQEWQIASISHRTPVVICLRLVSLVSGQSEVKWIFRDAVSDESFRRLSRITLQQQYKGHHDPGHMDG